MNPKKQKAGRLGGLATFRKYGREGMVACGKKGGRPRALTIEERQQQLLKAQENKKEVEDTPSTLPGNLKELKKRYLHQRRSTGNKQYKAGEG